MISALRKSIPATIRKAGGKKGDVFKDQIGCTPNQLKTWLENHFHDGMTWENYGAEGRAGDSTKRWSVDHVKPRTEFDLTDPEQQRRCNHYSNLQPLWHLENSIKGNRFWPARALLPFELKKSVAMKKMALFIANSHLAPARVN